MNAEMSEIEKDFQTLTSVDNRKQSFQVLHDDIYFLLVKFLGQTYDDNKSLLSINKIKK